MQNNLDDYKKPTNCLGCPLYNRPIVFSEKPKTKKESYLWIVGEAPGHTEVAIGRPFVGKAGELLRTVLQQTGYNDPVVITNACLCHPDQNKTPSMLAVKKCKYHLDLLKKKYPPKFIIVLGAIACKALGIKTTKIDNMRGKVFNSSYGPCLVTYHPARILRSKYRLSSLFALDLKKAIHLVRSTTENITVLPNKDKELAQKEAPEDTIIVLRTTKDIIDLLKSIPEGVLKAIDIETSIPDETGKWPDWGLNPYHPLNGIYSFAVAWDNVAYSFPVDPKLETDKLYLDGDPETVKQCLKEFITRSDNFIAHNSKFEYQMLKHHLGVTPKFSHDTQLLAYLIKETLQGFYSLNTLIDVYLPQYHGFKETRKGDLLVYNAKDALYTLRLFHALSRELVELPQRDHILKAEEFLISQVVPLVANVEMKGVCIDWQKLIHYRQEVAKIKEKIEHQIKLLTGTANPRTHAFRQAFERILMNNNIPVARTDTGIPDLSKESLLEVAKIAHTEEVKKLVYYKLSHTKLDKSLTAYLEKYPTFLNPYTGRIHPAYRIDGTVTGRLSSEKPNFQQIPREGLFVCPNCNIVSEKVCPICGQELIELVNISKLIIPSQGCDLISVDYSQMEVRVLAHVTKDNTLCEVIKQGIDLHSYTASRIYKIPYEEIVANKDTNPDIKRKRQLAKSATFGIIYGITAKGLALNTGTTVAEAQNMIDKFYETYPRVKEWIDSIHKFVEKHHYVISPMGRVRHFEAPKITPEMLREAQNFPIQSYASDLTLAAAYKILTEIEKYKACVVGLVHDSIKIECPKHYTQTITKIVKDIMTNWIVAQYNFIVPLEIDIEIYEGKNTPQDTAFLKDYLLTTAKESRKLKKSNQKQLEKLTLSLI